MARFSLQWGCNECKFIPTVFLLQLHQWNPCQLLAKKKKKITMDGHKIPCVSCNVPSNINGPSYSHRLCGQHFLKPNFRQAHSSSNNVSPMWTAQSPHTVLSLIMDMKTRGGGLLLRLAQICRSHSRGSTGLENAFKSIMPVSRCCRNA